MKPLLLLLVALNGLNLRADIAEQIDPLFSEYNSSKVPGASVGIYQDDEVLYEKGYGLADLESKEASGTLTNYRLASVTKQFTAMAILQLVASEKLTLSETLTDIFPGFPSYGKQIQVRHLLNHTGGLRDYEDLIPGGQTEQVTDRDVLDMMKQQNSTYFTPGSQYRYSNGGYCVLAQIVEARSETSFAKFVERNIFRPLGMTESRVYVKPSFEISHRAYGHSRSGGGFTRTDQSVTSATQGDGGVYTSTRDFLPWDRALYTDVLIPLDLLKQAFTPGVLNSGAKTSYGFGWQIGTYRGLLRHSHTGSTIGFRTAVQRFPDKHFTVVVLVNRAESSPWTTAESIADRLLFNH